MEALDLKFGLFANNLISLRRFAVPAASLSVFRSGTHGGSASRCEDVGRFDPALHVSSFVGLPFVKDGDHAAILFPFPPKIIDEGLSLVKCWFMWPLLKGVLHDLVLDFGLLGFVV